MSQYDEAELLRKVELALVKVRTLLDTTRHPTLAADVPHRYDEKYLLVEFLTRAASGGVLTCLEAIGLEPDSLATLREWAKERTVTLRFEAREDCTFLGEKTREVVSPVQRVTEIKGPEDQETSIRDKVVTTVTEYWWSFEFSYRLIAFQGNSPETGLTISQRQGSVGRRTSTEKPPRPVTLVRPALDVDASWLLRHVDAKAQLSFAIDRHDPRCHTPRRNPAVDAALTALARFTEWSSALGSYLRSDLLVVQQEPSLNDFDHGALTTRDLFSPVIPLFEGDGRGGAGDPVLPVSDVNAFLEEQLRCLSVKRQALAESFPQNDTVITVHVMNLLVALKHARQVCRDHAAGVDYVEDMLRQQLVAAIGKVLSPVDFAEYMTFHHRKLFKPEFRPQPFSYAIRRPDHDPEGTLSLEVQRSTRVPIQTLVQRREATSPMSLPLDAATRVSFLGERYLHAWVAHQFSGASETLQLVARARQFSSYVLLVGRIAAADAFEPSHAIIVQNKDVVEIPLDLEQIPTPKEFRDAIESLSPEQQRFAKAFRGMQLESTLFGVCVIQIKPQLERLLKLPPDSLTKEIKLTQDLLELFMDYQIPSDLLSYEGRDPEATLEDKLERVRGYVSRMQELIQSAKDKELEEAQQREAFRRAEADSTQDFMEIEICGSAIGPPDTASFSASAFDAGGDYDPFGSPSGDPFAGAMSGGDPFASAASADPFAAPGASADPFAAPPSPSPPAAEPPGSPPAEPVQQPRRPDAESPQQAAGGALDFTQIPRLLDRRVEQLDEDSALRATIINPGKVWEKSYLESLLADVAHKRLFEADQRSEQVKALDLIGALSKSGDLAFQDASLHVVIASTHCFDKTLVETVVQGNENPIEKVERSSMIVATTIHDRPAAELLLKDQRQRFFATSPQLEARERLPEGPGSA